jgi:glycosyltransferase involved in cell wall biosynthesis
LEAVSALSQAEPLVTIGMPTFNREWSLPRVLDSMLDLDYDKARMRICFVDNESTDATMKIIEDFRTKHQQEYESIVVVVARSNISKARNIGFEKAAGTDYIFFLDSDILVKPDTIRRLLAIFKADPKVGIASLPWDNRNARKRAGFLYNAFTAPNGPHPAYKVGNGCNIVSMRAADEVGGFNEKLRVHEDGEYCYRLRRKGFKIVCDFSSEGTHLRDIKVDPHFYFNLMKDSAATYRELIRRGSPLQIVKVVSSVAIVASFALLLLYPGLYTGVSFAAILVFSFWLNSAPIALDDGIHVRAAYRPLIGLLMTAATVMISAILLYNVAVNRQK